MSTRHLNIVRGGCLHYTGNWLPEYCQPIINWFSMGASVSLEGLTLHGAPPIEKSWRGPCPISCNVLCKKRQSTCDMTC